MQQVNLYLDEFKKIEPAYSANIILIANGYALSVGLVMLLALFIINQIQKHNLNQLEQQAQYWQQQLEGAKTKFPEPKVDALLVNEISDFEQQVKQNTHILNYLKQQKLEQQVVKSSNVLGGLTQVKSEETWLSYINLAESGKTIELTGYALHGSSLPKYLEQLSQVAVFKKTEFERVEVSQHNQYLKFTVSSKIEEEDVELSMENFTRKNR